MSTARRLLHAATHHGLARHTIYAPATAAGKAGVAVIRVSGQQAAKVATEMSQPATLPTPRHAVLRSIVHPATREVLDKGLLLFFPGPRSFTGEDVVELQVHGGRAVVTGVLDALAACSPSFRLAEPGEFTQRAFMNGRLDLTEVEGLADLLNAETEAQRRQSLQQASGSLKHLYEGWRSDVVKALAHVEAIVDFGEEEASDSEDHVLDQICHHVQQLRTSLVDHLQDNRRGEILRRGVHATIFGPPNAGKSSLLNYLTGRTSAIVSSVPGTTRDIIEQTIDVGGYPMVVGDTAGIRHTTVDEIEQIGIKLAFDRLEHTDLKLFLLDFYELRTSLAPAHQLARLIDDNTVVIVNKVDTERDRQHFMQHLHLALAQTLGVDPTRVLGVSIQHALRLDSLMQALTNMLRARLDGGALESAPVITQARHRSCLTQCLQQLDAFLDKMHAGADRQANVVLGAEHLRLATNALGRITGAVDVEDVLDVVFRDFCIGK
ncbi:mitochondrial splicing system protein [Sorochytrium milnesiophthora]